MLAAIERTIDGFEVDEKQRAMLGDLGRAWRQVAEIQGTEVQGFAVQRVRVDGSEATGMVSDTQLAAGWLYADLVHADPRGPKADSLAFSLSDRYVAAVSIFSRMAGLTVATLVLVEALRDSGVLAVDPTAWQGPSVVAVSAFREGTACVSRARRC